MKNELRKICTHMSFLNDLDRYSKANAKKNYYLLSTS
nr:hypothetical protein [uncultured Acinetobacter sp.]